MSKQIIVSGVQPTGNLHLGNYLGAVKNWLELQNDPDYELFIFLADLHSMTGNMSPEERKEQVIRTAVELLALGLDTDKTTFFVQSFVPECTELAWIFNCITPLGELSRMTQWVEKSGIKKTNLTKNKFYEYVNKLSYEKAVSEQQKDMIKMSNQVENVNMGLFDYPVLMASDILLYKGDKVPAGTDQVQHIELTRDIARWFNNRYGNFFPETKPLLTETPKVMSLLEPTKKMSKSLGGGHILELADEPKVVEQKIRKAVTATEGGMDAPGVENLLTLLKEFGNADVFESFKKAEKEKNISYGDLKQAVSESVANYFEEFRTKREELLLDNDKVADLLFEGAEKARKIAVVNMGKIREMVGLR